MYTPSTRSESISALEVTQALEALNLAPVPEREIKEQIEHALTETDAGRFATTGKRSHHVMGRLMRVLRGRVEGRRLESLVRTRLAAATPEGIPA